MDCGLIRCQTGHLEEAPYVFRFVRWRHVCELDGVRALRLWSHVQRGAGPESPLPDRRGREHEQVSLGGINRSGRVVTKRKERRGCGGDLTHAQCREINDPSSLPSFLMALIRGDTEAATAEQKWD